MRGSPIMYVKEFPEDRLIVLVDLMVVQVHTAMAGSTSQEARASSTSFRRRATSFPMRSIELVRAARGLVSAMAQGAFGDVLRQIATALEIPGILIAATVRRRSSATGWRSAMRRMAFWPISASRKSSCASRSITAWASVMSRLAMARMAPATSASARSPIRASSDVIASSSAS